MAKRTVETDRFAVKTENGKEYMLIEFQDFISTPPSFGPQGEFKGLKRLVTTTGLSVVDFDPEKYKILETNEVIRRPRKVDRETQNSNGNKK
jgi:hypothetical protein